MTQQVATQPLADIARGLREPGMGWQSGILLACIVTGWTLLCPLRASLPRRQMLPSALSVGVENVVRVLSPLMVVLLLPLAPYLLATWQSGHVLALAL